MNLEEVKIKKGEEETISVLIYECDYCIEPQTQSECIACYK